MSALAIVQLTLLTLGAPPNADTADPVAVQVSPPQAGSCESPRWARDGSALSYERVFSEARRIELHILHSPLTTPMDQRVKMPKFRARQAPGQRFSGKKSQNGTVCRELSWGPKDNPSAYAYSCNRDGAFQVYWSGGVQLTQGSASSGQPALSPVSWAMTCVRGTQQSGGLAYVQDLMQDATVRPLAQTRRRVDRMPVFSPDGQSLLFVGHNKRGADIYLIRDLNKPRAVRLTRARGDELNPSWSPDGTKFAYFGSRRGSGERYDLFVQDVGRRAKPRRLAKDVVLSEQQGPAWTPDGRYLVYVKNRQRGDVIDPLRAVAVGGRPDRPLPTGTVSNRSPAITSVEGRAWVAYSALGRVGGEDHTWRKIFVFPLDALAPAP